MYSNLLKNQIYTDDIGFRCNECSFQSKDREAAELHVETNEHNIRMKYAVLYNEVMDPQQDYTIPEIDSENLLSNRIIFKNPSLFVCSACKSTLTHLKAATEHIVTNGHLENLKKTCKPEKKKSKSNKKDKPEKEEVKSDYRAPLRSSLLEYGSRYSKLCLEPGPENIYNIDRQFLNNLEQGIQVTVVRRRARSIRCCIPCTTEFPDYGQVLYEHLHLSAHKKNVEQFQRAVTKFGRCSKLDFAKSFMFEAKDSVNCLSCDIWLRNDPKFFIEHVNSAQHQANSQHIRFHNQQIFNGFRSTLQNAWYYIQVYLCDICCTQFSMELKFVEHIESHKYIEKFKNASSKYPHLTYTICIPCATLWYGNPSSYTTHCRWPGHINTIRKGKYEVREIPSSVIECLEHLEENVAKLEKLSDKVNQSEQEKEISILNCIEDTVKSIYPNAKAYLFGSRISYMGFPDSDLDVYLDCENGYDGNTTAEQRREYLLASQECFTNASDTWELEAVLMSIRIPIITLCHKPSGLKCDISFIGGLSVEKSKIIRSMNNAFRPCRQMILFCKKWLRLCNLNITSFAIACCVIFFLQQKGILPSVVRLIEIKNKSKLISGWETGISEEVPVTESNFILRDLLRDFFKFYSTFDYKTFVVSSNMGQTIEKRLFADLDQLPPEMDSYKEHIKVEDIETFQITSPMCIQDPIDLTQNMTKAISKLQLRTFIQYCGVSADRLGS